MLVKALAVSLAVLFLACSQTEKEIEIVRIPVVTEVVKEVPVVTEVPVLAITEVPVEVIVTSPDCPPASEVDWLIWSLEDARAMHLVWADYLADHPPEEGSLLKRVVDSREMQLEKVAAYDRRLGIVRQLQRACAQ